MITVKRILIAYESGYNPLPSVNADMLSITSNIPEVGYEILHQDEKLYSPAKTAGFRKKIVTPQFNRLEVLIKGDPEVHQIFIDNLNRKGPRILEVQNVEKAVFQSTYRPVQHDLLEDYFTEVQDLLQQVAPEVRVDYTEYMQDMDTGVDVRYSGDVVPVLRARNYLLSAKNVQIERIGSGTKEQFFEHNISFL